MTQVKSQQLQPKDGPTPILPEIFTRYRERVEGELRSAVPTGDKGLYTALSYHMGWADEHGHPLKVPSGQGKALRPALCLFACEALGGDWASALPAAAALELVHNFSLIHDDIQDGDTERRHRPTVWYLWGKPRALVAGDAMRSLADLTTLKLAERGVPEAKALRSSSLLAQSYLGMIQGQCLDLAFEGSQEVGLEDYLTMVSCKTGYLIRCGLEMGAMLACDEESYIRAFARYGAHLGVVFQVKDDLLGLWGDERATGKPAGNDIRRKKKSFPIVYALERADHKARKCLGEIYSRETLADDDVAQVLAILDTTGAQEHAHSLIAREASLALDVLEGVPLSPWARGESRRLVEFLGTRAY